MQGQKVDKITINGRDFFLNDLRAASQTLPADLVAQVEVFDTHNQNARKDWASRIVARARRST